MASRLAHKPDPSIKKNVLRSRSEARKGKKAHVSVVVTSMVATLLTWAAFANQDAQMIQAAQAASTGQTGTTMLVPAQSAVATQVPASRSNPSFSLEVRR